jgi:hypothetical protein
MTALTGQERIDFRRDLIIPGGELVFQGTVNDIVALIQSGGGSGGPGAVITMATNLSGQSNNVTPAGLSNLTNRIYVPIVATANWTGMQPGLFDGQLVRIFNAAAISSGFMLQLNNQNALSTAGWRFIGSSDAWIAPQQLVRVIYDFTLGGWLFDP